MRISGLAVGAFLAAALGSGCTAHTTVRGDLLVDRGGAVPEVFHYEAVTEHDTSALAVACAFTAVFYGGACWAYAFLPFDNHEDYAVALAQRDVERIGNCAVLREPVVEGGGSTTSSKHRWWVKTETGAELSQLQAQQLCEKREARPPPPPNGDPPGSS